MVTVTVNHEVNAPRNKSLAIVIEDYAKANTIWDKVLKSGLSKFYGRQPLKNLRDMVCLCFCKVYRPEHSDMWRFFAGVIHLFILNTPSVLLFYKDSTKDFHKCYENIHSISSLNTCIEVHFQFPFSFTIVSFPENFVNNFRTFTI